MEMYLPKVISKKLGRNFFFYVLEVTEREEQDLDPDPESGSVCQKNGFADQYPDPYQKVTDPELAETVPRSLPAYRLRRNT
jgi:hypothetical protein